MCIQDARLRGLPGRWLEDPSHLARDDGFAVVRKARTIAQEAGFEFSIELLPTGELLKFATGSSRFSCLVAGSIVSTEYGIRRVEQIRVGHKLWAYDPDHGRLQLASVWNIRSAQASSYVEINHQLRVTTQHPVFVDGQWLPAGLIHPGHHLLNLEGQSIHVDSVELHEASVTVFDLSVEFPHTFFANDFLVHNKS